MPQNRGCALWCSPCLLPFSLTARAKLLLRTVCPTGSPRWPPSPYHNCSKNILLPFSDKWMPSFLYRSSWSACISGYGRKCPNPPCSAFFSSLFAFYLALSKPPGSLVSHRTSCGRMAGQTISTPGHLLHMSSRSYLACIRRAFPFMRPRSFSPK